MKKLLLALLLIPSLSFAAVTVPTVTDATTGATLISGDVTSTSTLTSSSAGYDVTTGSWKIYEINPLADQYVSTSRVDTTNISAATHYYPAATGSTMDGYKDLSVSGKFIDADGTLTLTLEVMNDEDTTSGDWVPIYFYDDKANATVNTLTVTNGTLTIASSANNANFRYYRWVVVASGATNTVVLKSRRKAL